MSVYYNLFVVALETGLRIGELMALTWSDIDLKKKVLYVRHTLCYFRKDGKYTFEMHDTKTKNGRRTIPLTQKAYEALRRQKVQKLEIELNGRKARKYRRFKQHGSIQAGIYRIHGGLSGP